jgi:phospholipid/cholesterol/gamma-HCH transport system permease protein
VGKGIATRLSSWVVDVLDAVLLVYASAKGALVEGGRGARPVARAALRQVAATVDLLPVVALAALVLGLVTIVQADRLLPRFGMSRYVEAAVVTTIVREAGPLATALLLIGRSGAALAAEIGHMRLSRELEALGAMGVNLEYFIVLPRIMGFTVAVVGLTAIFDAAAIAGGYGAARTLGLLAPSRLFDGFLAALSEETLRLALVKAALFGAATAAVCALHGMRVDRAPREVTAASGRGVLDAIVLCFLLNAAVTLYGIG